MPNEELITATGKGLIFLISQPGSGSTLLQRMLGEHSWIHTTEEPWLMLPLASALLPLWSAEFNADFARQEMRIFLESIDGDSAYFRAIRKSAASLYGEVLARSGKRYFLDKTPRYYHIIPELQAIFPDARFLFLIRNPLAVLSSILKTHTRGDWTQLGSVDQMHDLTTSPRKILDAIRTTSDACVVHFEDVVRHPEGELRRVCLGLDIPFEATMTRYRPDETVSSQRRLGVRSVERHQQPVSDYAEAWRSYFDTARKSALAHGYLAALGPELISEWGYNYDDLVHGVGPPRARDSVWRLLEEPEADLKWWQRLHLSLARSLHHRGAWRTLLRFGYIVVLGRVPKR